MGDEGHYGSYDGELRDGDGGEEGAEGLEGGGRGRADVRAQMDDDGPQVCVRGCVVVWVCGCVC